MIHRLNGYRKDFTLLFHPNDALRLAQSRELREYLYYGGLNLTSSNMAQWGLPDRYCGLRVVVRYDQPEGQVDIQCMGHRERLER